LTCHSTSPLLGNGSGEFLRTADHCAAAGTPRPFRSLKVCAGRSPGSPLHRELLGLPGDRSPVATLFHREKVTFRLRSTVAGAAAD
jgi:hypothetical protein